MSICTRCPYGAADSEGNILPEYAGKEWKDVPCSGCELIHGAINGKGSSIRFDNDRQNRSKTFISLDQLKQGDGMDFECNGNNHTPNRILSKSDEPDPRIVFIPKRKLIN